MRPEDIERIKDLLPTTLGSAEIREQIAADILRRSVFSARMASVPYLAKLREVCAMISAGAIDRASARNTLEGVLEQMGHSMQDEGGLQNPASIRRLNLIIDTQRQMAASVSRIMGQTEATRYANPAWELTRLESRAVPRADWAARWNLAGESVGWVGALKTRVGGRMVALKDSPIWQALGDGVGGFKDTLRNPYPPFAYASGLGWIAVSREECEALGLDVDATSSSRQDKDGASSTDATGTSRPRLAPDGMTLAEAVEKFGMPKLVDGLLA